MYGGMIIEQAPVANLLQNPRHPYTQALLAAIPDPDPENATRFREVPPGEPPSLPHPPSGCRFLARRPALTPGTCDVKISTTFEPAAGHPGAGRPSAAARP